MIEFLVTSMKIIIFTKIIYADYENELHTAIYNNKYYNHNFIQSRRFVHFSKMIRGNYLKSVYSKKK